MHVLHFIIVVVVVADAVVACICVCCMYMYVLLEVSPLVWLNESTTFITQIFY